MRNDRRSMLIASILTLRIPVSRLKRTSDLQIFTASIKVAKLIIIIDRSQVQRESLDILVETATTKTQLTTHEFRTQRNWSEANLIQPTYHLSHSQKSLCVGILLWARQSSMNEWAKNSEKALQLLIFFRLSRAILPFIVAKRSRKAERRVGGTQRYSLTDWRFQVNRATTTTDEYSTQHDDRGLTRTLEN